MRTVGVFGTAMSVLKKLNPLKLPPPVGEAAEEKKQGLAPAMTGWQPQLKVRPLMPQSGPRRFARVPTHAVGVFPEQREYPRASLKLPLRLKSVDGRQENFPVSLVTRDISSTGVFFLSPRDIAVGSVIELEIVLVSRPMGLGNVTVVSQALVRRVDASPVTGWYGIAAKFSEVEFGRDDGMPWMGGAR